MIRLFHSLAILGLIWMTVACNPDPAQVDDLFAAADPGVEIAEDFEMIFSDSAVIKARIEGPLLFHYMDPANPRDEFPEGVRVRFYDRYGALESRLVSNYAIRFAKDQKVLMQDSVVMKNIAGERLQTSELIWDELAGIVKTDKFAKITKADGTVLYCYGFISNEQFTDYTLLSIEGPVNIDALKE